MKRVKRVSVFMLAMMVVIGIQSATVLADENVVEVEAGTMEKGAEMETGIKADVNVESARQENAEVKVGAENVGQEDGKINAENVKEENMEVNAEVESGLIEAYAMGNEVASGTCGDNLTWVLTDDGTMTISGTGEMWSWRYVGDVIPWGSVREEIKTVIIKENVTSIGYSAFSQCRNLSDIVIPSSVIDIGDNAFGNCSSLAEVILPVGITDIRTNTFAECTGLKHITIPLGVTSIGEAAFWRCSSLTDIIIPSGVTSIGNSAFLGCSSLSEVTLPSSVTDIGVSAFENCSMLMNITIPSGVKRIRYRTFFNCDSLSSVIILPGITSIENSAFGYCSSLTDIIIPSGVTSIGNSAFSQCSSLSDIVIPSSVSEIGTFAFSSCEKLKNISLSDAMTVIQNSTFLGCTGLLEIEIPATITEIKYDAFSYCTSLSKVEIPSMVKKIGGAAFSNCTSLESIYFEGDAPEFSSSREVEGYIDVEPFLEVTANVYYIENSTWTAETMLDYGGKLTWIARDLAAELAIVLESTDKEYFIGSGSNAVIKCTGELDDFVSVEVDGRLLDSSCYTAMEEPTVLTLLSAYMDTLSIGNHTVTLNYTYGSIDSTLTVIEKNETVNGDENKNIENAELAIVLDVTDKSYLINSGDNATIKCTGELKDFVNVFMDGQIVDTSYYSVVEGSTVLTFLSSYLDTLSVGDHLVTLNYTYGSIDTTLTVIDNESNVADSNTPESVNGTDTMSNVINTTQNSLIQGGVPKTGDDSLMMLWMVFTILVGCSCLVLVWMRNRQVF